MLIWWKLHSENLQTAFRNQFCLSSFNSSDPAIKVWAGTSSWTGPLNLQWVRKGRKKAESEKGGMRGRGSIGAGLGLNAPLRFGVLMENCGRAGPTAATVAGREARDQTRLWREREGEKVAKEGGTNSPEGAGLSLTYGHFCQRISPNWRGRKTANNKELDQLMEDSGEALKVILSSS